VKGVTKLKYKKNTEATIRRLSRYSRRLEEMDEKGEKVVSSAQLANMCMVNAASGEERIWPISASSGFGGSVTM